MFRKIITTSALAVAATLAMATPASAQGVPVVDPGNIAQTIKVAKNGIEQIQQLKAQVEQMGELKNTIGAIGEGKIGNILSVAGLDFNQQKNDLMSQFTKTLPGIIDGLPNSELGKSLGVTAGDAAGARTDIDKARRFTLKTFFNGSNATMDEVMQRQGVREAALRDSASAGFATAVVTKARLGESEATIKALNEQMAASKDLRTDVQSGNAVAMANLQQMVIQNQLLAQLLEVQATGNMTTTVNSTN